MLPIYVTRNIMANQSTLRSNLYDLSALSVPLQNKAISAYTVLAKEGLAPEQTAPFRQQVRNLDEVIRKIRKDYPEYDARLVQVIDETSTLGVGFCYDLWSDASETFWSLLILKNKFYSDIPIKKADPTFGSAWAHVMAPSKARVEFAFPL